jgi:hypothetical protein
MVIEPIINEHGQPIKACFHCDAEITIENGGILWWGATQQVSLCGDCARRVIPAMVKDFTRLEIAFVSTEKRRLKYIVEAGEEAKKILNYPIFQKDDHSA